MTINEIKSGLTPSYTITDFDIAHSEAVQRSVIEPLLCEEYTNENGKVSAVFYHNDVHLLFNQQRLEKVLGKDSLKAFFDSLAPHSDALRELRSKCSDSDLAALCKSRYIQSPSEVLAWSSYLNEHYESLMNVVKSEYEAKAEAAKAKAEAAASAAAPAAAASAE